MFWKKVGDNWDYLVLAYFDITIRFANRRNRDFMDNCNYSYTEQVCHHEMKFQL